MTTLAWYWPFKTQGSAASPRSSNGLAAALAATFARLAEWQTLSATASTAKAIAAERLVGQLAALTIGTYDRTAASQRAKGPLHRRLNYEISDVCSGVDFWAAIWRQLIEDNNAYAYIIASPGPTLRLRVLPPEAMTVRKPDPKGDPWRVEYRAYGKVLPTERVWHLRWASSDGATARAYEGKLAVFELARRAEKLAYEFVSNGGTVRRFWKYVGASGRPTATQREQLDEQQEMINEILSRASGKAGNVVIPSMFEADDASPNLRDSQLLESRDFDEKRILSLYGIDPDAPFDLEKLYTNAIVPRLEYVEQRIAADLLTPQQRARWKIAHVPEGRFRGSITEWLQTLGTGVEKTILTSNEARRMAGLGLRPAADGDALMNPNTTPAAVSERRSNGESHAGDDDTNAE